MAKTGVAFHHQLRFYAEASVRLQWYRITVVLLGTTSGHVGPVGHLFHGDSTVRKGGTTHEEVRVVVPSYHIRWELIFSARPINAGIYTSLDFAWMSSHIFRPIAHSSCEMPVLDHLLMKGLVYAELWVWMPAFVFLQLKTTYSVRWLWSTSKWKVFEAFNFQLFAPLAASVNEILD